VIELLVLDRQIVGIPSEHPEAGIKGGRTGWGTADAFSILGPTSEVSVMYQKGRKKGTTEFSVAIANGAREVAVVGDFSSWKPVAMKKQKNDRFAASLPLPTGVYEYRFIVDGQWQSDPDHNHWAPNPYGTFNSVAQVQ
jgi:1,4-alpha-glucan branching enzyme